MSFEREGRREDSCNYLQNSRSIRPVNKKQKNSTHSRRCDITYYSRCHYIIILVFPEVLIETNFGYSSFKISLTSQRKKQSSQIIKTFYGFMFLLEAAFRTWSL